MLSLISFLKHVKLCTSLKCHLFITIIRQNTEYCNIHGCENNTFNMNNGEMFFLCFFFLLRILTVGILYNHLNEAILTHAQDQYRNKGPNIFWHVSMIHVVRFRPWTDQRSDDFTLQHMKGETGS